MQEKFCRDCKFFIQHYTRQGAKFDKILSGHCVNRLPNGRFRKTERICECFEDGEKGREDEIKKSISETLNFISKKLEDLESLLKYY